MSIDEATPQEWDKVTKEKVVWEEIIPGKPKTRPVEVTVTTPCNVERPPHYQQGNIECIDYIEQQLGDLISGYYQGNVIKYLHRWRYKNGVEDLRKARWYLDRLIEDEVNAGGRTPEA